MKKMFEVTDMEVIADLLASANYGTLALSKDDEPYVLPINFALKDKEVFFHGAKKGKKVDFMSDNSKASFSVVEELSLLPSYFSCDSGDASPATHLFKSVCIDGDIEFIEDYEKKIVALKALMQKYQPEGGYKVLDDKAMYEKIVNATCIFKLVPNNIKAKFNLGQNYNDKRYAMVVQNLKKRGSKKDMLTLKAIESIRNS
jgi:nitroimidazol reductase NimA-like FMN-containing flavoprotein (pyridoxamine 5'-phosphate oxidase superfamily)